MCCRSCSSGGIRIELRRLTGDISPRLSAARVHDDIGPGLRILRTARLGRRARHMLLYRAGAGAAIDVLRVLHDAMDIERQVSREDR